MIPNYYECSCCRERFEFAFREVYYHLGSDPAEGTVLDDNLLSIPVRPGWCKDCHCLSLVEDIAPLRNFESAYGAVKQGRPVEYPVPTEYCDPDVAIELVGAYLRWRLGRKRRARALCCGGSSYVFMFWGSLIAALLLWGPGKWSVDRFTTPWLRTRVFGGNTTGGAQYTHAA